ncbi:MAG: hypothetical protein Q4A17_08330 [Thermoguttaceae bacterium]|nr:hypothetical protein [Thermoguttaceae bacterium]
MVNSREKGARAERELAGKLRELLGVEARRGQQFCGANGDADVVGIPGVHIEAKMVEKLNLELAMDQSRRDARPGEIPVVIHRRKRKPWLVTVPLEELKEFCLMVVDAQKSQEEGLTFGKEGV